MMNNNNIIQNQFCQIQYLLNEISNNANKIQELILQINNIMNQMNQMDQMNYQLNAQINQMNNYMNMMEINQMNLNNNNLISKEKRNDLICNIQFQDVTKKITVIQFFDKNKTINELINQYFVKIGRNDYVDNYDKYYYFLYNSSELNEIKNMKIKESNLRDFSRIYVSNKSGL